MPTQTDNGLTHRHCNGYNGDSGITPQGIWLMRFARIFPALLLGLVFALAGCETTAPYGSCPLDKEVTDKGICTGTAGTTSCVVHKHPQCDQDICLSYFGKPAVCTQKCTSDAECPAEPGQNGTAICWTFAPADATKGTDADRYCVPPSRIK